jgi:hypothetical protein
MLSLLLLKLTYEAFCQLTLLQLVYLCTSKFRRRTPIVVRGSTQLCVFSVPNTYLVQSCAPYWMK